MRHFRLLELVRYTAGLQFGHKTDMPQVDEERTRRETLRQLNELWERSSRDMQAAIAHERVLITKDYDYDDDYRITY